MAAAQWLTPLIDVALIMIIGCQSCCCFAFPNTPVFSPTVFHILASVGAGVLQMFGCLPSTPCNLLAANQQPPLPYCSDTCWYAELNGRLMLYRVAWKPANEGLWFPKWQAGSLWTEKTLSKNEYSSICEQHLIPRALDSSYNLIFMLTLTNVLILVWPKSHNLLANLFHIS